MANISERMAKKKQYKNESCLPNDQIEMLAQSLMQSIYDYWESFEGQNSRDEYMKSNKTGTVITCVNAMPEIPTVKV